MKKVFSIALLLGALSLTTACKKTENLQDKKKQVLENYANIVLASYEDSREAAKAMQTTLAAMVKAPNTGSYRAAKEAWLAARVPYLQTEAYRMYAGPIDDDAGPEGFMNGWPMDEAYVDYVKGDMNTGIINRPDLFPNMTPALLKELNEKDGEANIATGYHAIEFLLWGQDQNALPNDAGLRAFTDYLPTTSSVKNVERRGQYLNTAADLLITDLNYLVEAWKDSQENYRKNFLANPKVSLRLVLQGAKELIGNEMAGERMQVIYDTRNQEDEHSCFSDNTHNDVIWDIQGLFNVYTGTYKRLDGTLIKGISISDLVREKDPKLDADMLALFAVAQKSAQSIVPPFDQAILKDSERAKIAATIQALKDISQKYLLVYDLIKD